MFLNLAEPNEIDSVAVEAVPVQEKQPHTKLYWIEGQPSSEGVISEYRSAVLRYSVAKAIGANSLEDIFITALEGPMDEEFIFNLNNGVDIEHPHLNLVIFEYNGVADSINKFLDLYAASGNPFNQFIILDYADHLRTGRYHNEFTEFLAQRGFLQNTFNVADLQNIQDLTLQVQSRLKEKELFLRLYFKSLGLDYDLLHKGGVSRELSCPDLHKFDVFTIDLVDGAYYLKKDGEPVDISPAELRLLVFFLINNNRTVTVQELSLRLSGDSTGDIEDDSCRVEVCISRVRKIIDNEKFNRLINRRGFGYQFRA